MGGPPLVSLTRVKVGGSDKNEEEERRIRSIKTLPQPIQQIIICTSDDIGYALIPLFVLVGAGEGAQGDL